MSASTTKQVIVDRFDREPVRGFANPQSFLQPAGCEILTRDGAVNTIPYQQIKTVSFVRDLDSASVLGERREYVARPKTAGLWVAFRFRDGDRLEGLLPNNLQMVDAAGYQFTPPEAAGNTQRVFVPRQALSEVTVLGVVGTALRAKKPKPEPAVVEQITLFSED